MFPHFPQTCGAFLAVVIAGLYFHTLYPSVGGGDSGELISAAHSLGIAHPPGYPLYTVVGHLFTWLPFGTVAWRLNLFSAVSSAFASWFLFLAVWRWGRALGPALIAQAMFSLSPLVWRYSVTAEVFALNNFFCALLLYCLVRFYETREAWLAHFAFFAGGLSLSHHHTSLFVVFPFLGAIAWWVRGRYLSLVACFAVGLLPYLYLPWAATRSPEVAWGDPSTISGFLTHFLRREYGTFQLSPSSPSAFGGFFSRLAFYLWDLLSQAQVWGVPAAAAAFVTIRHGASAVLLRITAGAFVLYVIVFHLLSNLDLSAALDWGVHARFWQQANLFVFAWAGLGLARVWRHRSLARPVVRAALVIVLVWLPFYRSFSSENRRHVFYFRDYATHLLASLPKDSLLLVRGDLAWNTARYLQVSENFRRDVKMVHWNLMRADWLKPQFAVHHPEIVFPGSVLDPLRSDGYSLPTFLEANGKRFNLFLCDENPKTADEPRFVEGYTRWPWGFAEVLLSDEQRMNTEKWWQESSRLADSFSPAGLRRFRADEWEAVLAVLFLKSQLETIERTMLEATTSRKKKWFERAAFRLEAFIRDHGLVYGDALPGLRKNLGLVYFKLSKFDPAMTRRAISSWEVFVKEAPPGYPEADKIAKFLETKSSWRVK